MRFALRQIIKNTRVLAVAALLGATTLGMIVGCADIITYSKDARKEGLKLYRDQQYADAAGAFRNAARQNPLDYQSYCYLGQSYTQLGQWEQAIHAFRTSLQVQLENFESKKDIAFRQNTLNGLANAIAKCDARDSQTNDVERRATVNSSAEESFILGKIFAYRGDPDSAIDAYNRAYLADPTNVYVVKEYGLYLERMGQTQQAELPLRKAYTLNPLDEDVNNALRRIGVVPGPGILDETALAKPIVPRGPIPELDVNRLTGNGATQTNGSPAPYTPSPVAPGYAPPTPAGPEPSVMTAAPVSPAAAPSQFVPPPSVLSVSAPQD